MLSRCHVLPVFFVAVLACVISPALLSQDTSTSQPLTPGEFDPGQPVDQAREKRAAVQDAVYSLDETVVIAQSFENSIFETPATVHTLSQKDLTIRRSAASLPEVLRGVPGVHVQKTAPGQGSPYIRGLTGFRTVLTIDGVRLNNSTFRDGPNQYWTTIDALSLDRVELVKGPSSVLYGSDAAGGAVGAFTEQVDMGDPGAEWRVGGRVHYRFSSAEASHAERLSFQAGYDGKFGVILGETLRHYGDLDGGGDVGRQSQTSYDFRAFDIKWRAKADEHVDFEFLFQSVRLNNVPRTHATVAGVRYHGTQVGTDQRRDSDQERDLALMTAILSDGSFFDEAHIRIGLHRQGEKQDRIRANGRRDRADFDVDTFLTTVHFVSDSPIGRLVYGFDLYKDDVDSRSRTINTNGTTTTGVQGPVADDANYTTLGVFVQNTIELSESSELGLGVRYSWTQTDADQVQNPLGAGVIAIDENYDAVVGGVSFLQRFTDEFNGFAAVNLGYRAPNLSDVSRLDVARSGELETAAPGVDPEFFLAMEIGPRLSFETWSLEAAYFYTFLFDTIIRRPTGATVNGALEVTKDNAGEGFIHGVELAGEWRFLDDLRLFGSFSWIEGRSDDFASSQPILTEEPISKLPPLYGRLGLAFDPADWGFHAAFDVEVVGEQDKLSPADIRDTQRIPPGGSPGYTIYNLRFSYDFDERKTVFLNLENLSDKNYRVHGSGSNEAGFNLIAGFDLRF